jgi:hypothetical protein
MAAPAQNRNRNALHSHFRRLVEPWRVDANAWLERKYGKGKAFVLTVETFRTALRQGWLWKQGRIRGFGVWGRPVTFTETSAHEFGLAEDVVVVVLDARGRQVARWDLLDELYKAVPPSKYGLETLAWEKPHLQPKGMDKKGVVAYAKALGIRENQLVGSRWPI